MQSQFWKPKLCRTEMEVTTGKDGARPSAESKVKNCVCSFAGMCACAHTHADARACTQAGVQDSLCLWVCVCVLCSQGHANGMYRQGNPNNFSSSKVDHCNLKFHLEIDWNAAPRLQKASGSEKNMVLLEVYGYCLHQHWLPPGPASFNKNLTKQNLG